MFCSPFHSSLSRSGSLSLLLSMTALMSPAAAHDAPSGWSYPHACCSGFDCREVSASMIEEGPNGYVIKTTGEVIPMTDRKVKPSPDGVYHWCSVAGADDTKTICLFVPPMYF